MKDNVMIAEFMGVYSEVQGSLKYRYKNEWHKDYDLLYHRSWDWLIPVLEKIEMDCQGVPIELLHFSFYSNISEVHIAVIEFIKRKTL
jgi:hypothetical protein|tara:strand:+ start:153 stop:416 length:264 start_codon:yes stop_codon:yes gene_type:complete